VVERESTQPTWVPDTPLEESEDIPTGRIQRVWLIGGRYELEGLISEGGMGRVFCAVHRDLNRRFALKLVHDSVKWTQDARSRFFNEARLASSLVHPNIVSVTDFGLDEHQGYYLVMELLSGETLRERIRQTPVSPRIAFDVLDQLAGALQYIHSCGIVHCDVKPENIFLSRIAGEPRRRNQVKLLDFGLSLRSEGDEQNAAGTPPYLAPERILGQPPSSAADVYSLGAIFYELLSGRTPYAGQVMEIIDEQLYGDPPPRLSLVAPEPIDGHTEELVMRALSRDPNERYPSAEAFHSELRAVMDELGMSARHREGGDEDPRLLARAGADAAARALQAAEAGDLEAVRRELETALARFNRAR
jgi:serine/threonine-protein kinase